MTVGPAISVVIVSWNSRNSLGRCLQSLAAARRSSDEVIVVDNASSDGSADFTARTFPWVHLIRNATNRHFAAGVNQGLATARGDAVLILNPDTVLAPFALSAAARTLNERPDVGALGFRMVNEDGTLQSLGAPRVRLSTAIMRWCLPDWVVWRLISAWPGTAMAVPDGRVALVPSLSGSAMCVRRSAIEECGGLDETLPAYAEDADLAARISDGGWSLACLTAVPITHTGGVSFRHVPVESRVLAFAATRALLIKRGRSPLLIDVLLAATVSLRWCAWITVALFVPSFRERARLARRAYARVFVSLLQHGTSW